MTVPATDWITALLLVIVLLEPVFILAVAPRLTRRMVKRDAQAIFEQHMRPGVREEVGRSAGALLESLRAEFETVHRGVAQQLAGVKVPAAGDIAAAVRDALLDAQAKAMEGKPDPMVSLRDAVRQELEAALDKLGADQEAMAVEDAAQVLSKRGVDARMTFAAQEEQFQAAVLKAAGTNGPVAVAALEQAKAAFPATYKVMVRQGPAAVPAFFKQAGLKAMVGGGGASDYNGAL